MRNRSLGIIRIALAGTAVLIAFLSWLFTITDEHNAAGEAARAGHRANRKDFKRAGSYAERSDVVAPKRHFDTARPAVSPLPLPQLADADPSPIAEELHSAKKTGVDDLSVVMNLFTHYRTRFRSYPVGEENSAFVNALSGQNPGHMAFISRKHPAIDAKGQLLDRWGQPYFFHLLGRDALEIRSAGPDQRLYTGDDLVTASPVAGEATVALKAD